MTSTSEGTVRRTHQWRGAIDRQSEEYRDLLEIPAGPSCLRMRGEK
jgi:hypothetical protein